MCSAHMLTYQYNGEKGADELVTLTESSHDTNHWLGEYVEYVKEEDHSVVTEITNGEDGAKEGRKGKK